jgi:pilus assembly protein Flp/PilA
MHRLVLLRRLLRSDSGQDLLEYGLLVALIAIVVLGAVTNTGLSLAGFWTGIATSIAAVA